MTDPLFVPEPAPSGPNPTVAVILVAALAAAAVLMWTIRRGDRRALAAAKKARFQLPERISLEQPLDDDA